MPYRSIEALVEESVAKLEAISERRNVLLREMHQMIRRRRDLGSVSSINHDDEEDLQVFLQRFKMSRDNPEVGSIITLSDKELFVLPSRGDSDVSHRSPSSKGKPPFDRIMRGRQRVEAVASPKMHAESSQLVSSLHGSLSATTVDEATDVVSNAPRLSTPPQQGSVERDDELDLFRKPPLARAQSRNPSHPPHKDAYAIAEAFLDSRSVSPAKGLSRQTEPVMFTEEQVAVVILPSEKDTSGEGQEEAVDASGTKSMEAASQMGVDVPFVNALNPQNLVISHAMQDAIMTDEGQSIKPHAPAGEVPSSTQIVPPLPGTSSLPHYSFLPAVPTPTKRPVIVLSSQRSGVPEPDYVFRESLPPQSQLPPPTPTAPLQRQHQFKPEFTLPPLRAIQPEYTRKSKSVKRKREGSSRRENGEWAPLGLNKWAATVNANPVWKKVARASKCLSTREWAIAMSELRLTRAIDRIESLKREGRWSFRQPKKQRAIGGVPKTHWDHLMDEMKWMRVDFREERKWKIALAYNLSTAVLDWHTAGTMEIRVAKGICVRWRRTVPGDQVYNMAVDEDVSLDSSADLADMEVDEFEESQQQHSTSLLGVDYGSDDDEDDDGDDDQDKDSQNVVNALEPSTLIEDALEDASKSDEPQVDGPQNKLQPKTEEVEVTLALVNPEPGVEARGDEASTAMVVDKAKPDASSGLKTTSNDPVLASQPTPSSNSGDTEHSSSIKSAAKSNIYAPFREIIAYSEDDKLFLDLEEFDMSKLDVLDANISDDAPLPPPDLTAIFPDLQILTLFDPTPVVQPVSDGKKRSDKRADRDDPTKRPDDILYTRLYPTGDFMMTKPTLIGPLRPSKNWKNGQWVLDETPVAPETDVAMKILDDNVSELFDSRSSSAPSVVLAMQMQAAFLKDKDNRKRSADHLWSNADDILLKSYIDKYPNNWALISECFNASRLTISTDKRTPRDCLDRWRDKWGPELRRPTDAPSMVDATPPPNSSQMTTRGVKRLASTSVSSTTPVGMATGSEPRKRRRHLLVQETIRKAGKKRAEALQKMQAAQRKPPAIHETHAQYSKLPKRTPAELSRVKAEKEARELQEIQQARKRQEELNRQTMMNRMMANGAVPQQQQQAMQQQQQQQQQPQVVTAMQRPVGAGIPPPSQVVPPIRSQVNISQQQRTNTPSLQSGPRAAQHMLQAHQARAAQHHQQAQVHALAQAQSQIQNNATAVNGNVPVNNPHMSPPYATRDVTSSPAHVSPPLNSAVPSTVNSPRPPSAQAHQLLQVPGNAGTRGGYYLPNVPNVQGYTTVEQIHTALRLQHQHQQQQQAQQQQQQAQQPLNAFPHPS